MLTPQYMSTKCNKLHDRVPLRFHGYRKNEVSKMSHSYPHLNFHIRSNNLTEVQTSMEKKIKKIHHVVKVEPRPKRGAVAWFVDLIEKALVWIMYDKSQPSYFLSGNYAPVKETPPFPGLPVKGYLPECLNGEFVMVGPNPKFAPVAGYNWLDGDGMIHGLRIKGTKASYVSRYVRTSKLKQEEYFGGAKFIKIGDLKGFFGLFMVLMHCLRAKLGVLDMSYGYGTGNTALVYHQGKLLALSECDKPYVVKVLEDGDLQTLGLLDYDKRLKHPFTAHPKVDPFTDEMFTFGYSFVPPYVTYRVINIDGVMLDPVQITLPEPVMMHDFAITENYAIFTDLPLNIRPKDMVKGKLIFSFDDTVEARFGVLPRYAKNDHDIRWFELPNCFIFHNANAWEEGDEVVLIACRLQKIDLDIFSGVSTKETLENITNQLYEMRFNMKTGEASQKELSAIAVDFPRINEIYTGRKQRYVYCTMLSSRGIIKFDLEAEQASAKDKLEVGGNVAGVIDLGPGRYGSEAIFVPRYPGVTGDEDDGYLIFFVYDENTGKSEVNVMDAKTMSAKPVAVVDLPARVPFGLHAYFISEEQIKSQVFGNTGAH